MRKFFLSGFTLIELMVTIAIVAVLLGLSIPSFSALVHGSRIKSVSSDLVSSINLAKLESIKRQTRITICASNNTDQSDPVCDKSAGNIWGTGWILFKDSGVVGKIDDDDEIINVYSFSGKNVNLSSDTFNRYASFLPGNLVSGNNGSSGEINICIVDSNVDFDNKRIISINASGRVHVKKSKGNCQE